MQRKVALLATTAFAALTLVAPAEAAGSGWYVSVLGGANWTDDHSFIAATTGAPSGTLSWAADGDTGFFVGGAIGMNFNQIGPGFRAEIEVAYRQANVDGLWTTFTTPGGTSSGALDYDFSNFSVMANAWYDFDVGGFKPYVGGGIGWAHAEADGSFSPTTSFDFEDDGFAWQLGAGVNFDISPNVKLGVGYRYFDGPDVTVDARPLVAVNGASGDLDNENHTAFVNITFGM